VDPLRPRFEPCARLSCFRSEFSERDIELQSASGDGLQLGLLVRIKRIGRADDGTENQRHEQGHESDDRGDHVTRPIRRVRLGKKSLKAKAREPGNERSERRRRGNPDCRHSNILPRSEQTCQVAVADRIRSH
jgi:hypothetical protein